MSSVRMCDKCGDIFSENAENWSTFSGAVRRRRPDGSRYSETIDQDACPACTNGTKVVTPRLALTPEPEGAPFPLAHPAPAGHSDPARIKELEHELGMDEPPLTLVDPGTAGG